MKVRFYITIGGHVYDFIAIWNMPFFVNSGDTVKLLNLLDSDQLFCAKKTKFAGKSKYRGLHRSLADFLEHDLSTKVTSVNWSSDYVSVGLTSELYDLSAWEAIL